MVFILRTLAERWKFILVSGLLTAAVMAGVSFMLPQWYRAQTSIFPPEDQAAFPFADIMQSLQVPIVGPSAVGANPATIYIDILQSRTVGERIVNEFNLKEVYGTDMMFEALGELHSHTSYSLLENGLLLVEYEDKDPQRAAAIANRNVELLDEFNRELSIGRAQKTREFVGRQLDERADDLAAAEDELRMFQEKHHTLGLEEQVKAAIEVVSELTAQAIALEVELHVLREYASTSSDEYRVKQQEYNSLLEQLRLFRANPEERNSDVVRALFPSFDSVPQLTLELARLMRKVKIEIKVYGMLVQEYEKARIDEARDTPTVSVLDPATLPEMRYRPKRKILTILGGVLGIGWSAMLSIFLAIWRQNNRHRDTFKEVIDPVVTDLKRMRGRG